MHSGYNADSSLRWYVFAKTEISRAMEGVRGFASEHFYFWLDVGGTLRSTVALPIWC
jgi:hypothetical protein